MKRFRMLAAFACLSTSLIGGGSAAYAEGFYFGEDTKGVTLSSNEADLNIRMLLQPRLDAGDVIKSKDGTMYETESDIYFRRIRLELTGSLLTKTIRYNLTLKGDKWDKAGNANEVLFHYAYIEWEKSTAFAVMAGKYKLPYSRVSLISDAKSLIIEGPSSTEEAKKLFGKSDAYYQPKLAVKGSFLDGSLSYEAAIADGWQNAEAIQTGRTVFKAPPLLAARVELSPPGLTDPKKSGSYVGKGRHFTLGLDYARQGSIEYKENDDKETRTLAGIDVSGHYEGFSAQFEYNRWKTESSDAAIQAVKPNGWFAEAGYFIGGLNIEPALRYESFNQNAHLEQAKERNTTAGVNWYLKGQSLKLGLNWVHTKYGANAAGKLANDDTKDVFQLQGQMYF